MDVQFLSAPGEVIESGALVVPNAVQLARRLIEGSLPYCEFVEARLTEQGEVIVVEVAVEVPQDRVHDIRPVERIAVHFPREDNALPEALALREDFPLVPHLNLRSQEKPRSLCLYDQSYDSVRLRWSIPAFVRQVREWLARTARGELLAADQPLEPFLVWSGLRLILPGNLHARGPATRAGRLRVQALDFGRGVETLLASGRNLGSQDASRNDRFIGISLGGQPTAGRAVSAQPTSVAELHSLLAEFGVDVLGVLRRILPEGLEEPGVPDARLIILTWLPKLRHAGGDVEGAETWAYLVDRPVSEICEAVGACQSHEGVMARLLFTDEGRTGAELPVVPLNVVGDLTRDFAAALNGAPPSDVRVTAIGAGALGSQLVMNLVRSGWGRWAIVDKDTLLPHNLARHALGGDALGAPKASALGKLADSILENDPGRPRAFDEDILRPSAALVEQLQETDLVLDLSASIPVARHLARDLDSSARRISLFFNPAGTDVVLLAEDAERTLTLDLLEMQYYRALVRQSELREHLRELPGRIRYAKSCRDVSSEIPQDVAATLAGVGARAARTTALSGDAQIKIWRTAPDLCITATELTLEPVRMSQHGDWTVYLDDGVLRTLSAFRQDRLPNETGGVLVGSYDMQRKILYIVDALPSPPDSQEYPTSYTRGIHGLRESVREVEAATAGNLHYVGEWHSHPEGYGCDLSSDDRKLFRWIEEQLYEDGVPPLMLILGDGGTYTVHAGSVQST